MKNIIITLMIVLSPWCVMSQNVSKVGTTAAPFLNIAVGARAVGLGGAYVAVANDATAMFWNPGGIATIGKNEAIFNHSEWIADINFDYVGVVIDFGNSGAAGFNATVMSVGDIERTTELQPEGTSEIFSPSSYALGIAYAISLTDRFSIGLNSKLISESILNSTARSFAFDIGTVYDVGFNGLKLGASISNLGAGLQMSGRDLLTQVNADPTRAGGNQNINANIETGKFDLPLFLRVGLSIDLLESTEKNSLLLAVDGVHPNDNTESINFGTEYIFNNFVNVRGGIRQLFSRDREAGFTIGGGIKYGLSETLTLKLDYVYQDFGRLKDIQMFTVGVGF